MIRLMLSVSQSVMPTQLNVSLIMSRSENFDKDAMGRVLRVSHAVVYCIIASRGLSAKSLSVQPYVWHAVCSDYCIQ